MTSSELNDLRSQGIEGNHPDDLRINAANRALENSKEVQSLADQQANSASERYDRAQEMAEKITSKAS